MSPNAVKITSGDCGEGKPVIDPAHGKDADRAAGTVDEFDVGRKNILQTEPVDRVRVSAAHLHNTIMPAGIGEATDLLSSSGDYFRIAKFIHKSHSCSGLAPHEHPVAFRRSRRMHTSWRSSGHRLPVVQTVKSIPPHFLHGLFVFAQNHEGLHLVERILLADLAHRKADMDEDPIPRNWQVILQQPKIDLASHAGYLHRSQMRSAGKEFDNLSGNG